MNAKELKERWNRIDSAIAQAASRVSRKREEIRVVLVTKTFSVPEVAAAYGMGFRDFAENRVQELLEKKESLPEDIRWHFIGQLQTNKVKQILGEVVLIHSLDRLELAEEIERIAGKKSLEKVDCLVQVNSSGEASKSGCRMAEAEALVGGLGSFRRIQTHGLMAIGPLTDDREKIRENFRAVQRLQGELQSKFPERDWTILSMGMSGDYEIAVEEGATLLRLGTAFFGPRD